MHTTRLALARRLLTLTCSLSDEFAKQYGAASSGALWCGPAPTPSLSPGEVILTTLTALQHNDEPQPHAGVALMRRFAISSFALTGEPSLADGSRVSPQELSRFFVNSQYCLLFDKAVVISFPTDTCSFEEGCAWQETVLESPSGTMLAKLGWNLLRGDDGCWRTSAISWHDFRDGFRPGIGEEEWDRSFG